MADRVGRARDGLRDAERAAGAADEGRFPGAELAGDGDDVARLEPGGDAAGERLGLLRRGCLDLRQNKPSWTARGSGSGSAGVASSETGGSTSRSSNPGIRRKSSSSTFSMAGV
jgi:hypothetical protein